MDEKTENRIHDRIDETHKLINETKIDYAETRQIIQGLTSEIKGFITRVEEDMYNIENGHIIKTRTKLTSICTQLKNQWYLITLLFGGIMGIVWMTIASFQKVK